MNSPAEAGRKSLTARGFGPDVAWRVRACSPGRGPGTARIRVESGSARTRVPRGGSSMTHAINGRQVFQQMGGSWPKTSAEILEWARTHDAFPHRFLNDLRENLPDR